MLATAEKLKFEISAATQTADDGIAIESALTLLANSQLSLDQLFYQLAARRISSGKGLD